MIYAICNARQLKSATRRQGTLVPRFRCADIESICDQKRRGQQTTRTVATALAVHIATNVPGCKQRADRHIRHAHGATDMRLRKRHKTQCREQQHIEFHPKGIFQHKRSFKYGRATSSNMAQRRNRGFDRTQGGGEVGQNVILIAPRMLSKAEQRPTGRQGFAQRNPER